MVHNSEKKDDKDECQLVQFSEFLFKLDQVGG